MSLPTTSPDPISAGAPLPGAPLPGAPRTDVTEAQRLRHLRLVLAQRQAEVTELARRTASPQARATLAIVGGHLARAIADLATVQATVTASAGASGASAQ